MDKNMVALYVDKTTVNIYKASLDMYGALKAQHEAIDLLFARLIELDRSFYPSESGQPWDAIVQGNKVIAKAKGE